MGLGAEFGANTMQIRGLSYICLLAGMAVGLPSHPSMAAGMSDKDLRNMLAITGTPGPASATYDPGTASTSGNAIGHALGLGGIEGALDNFDLNRGVNYFMSGSRADGGMAIALSHAHFPSRGMLLDLRWQFGQ